MADTQRMGVPWINMVRTKDDNTTLRGQCFAGGAFLYKDRLSPLGAHKAPWRRHVSDD